MYCMGTNWRTVSESMRNMSHEPRRRIASALLAVKGERYCPNYCRCITPKEPFKSHPARRRSISTYCNVGQNGGRDVVISCQEELLRLQNDSYLHIDIEPVPKNGIATSRLASLTVRCRPTAVRPAEQKRPHVASCTTTSSALSLLEAH